MNNWKTPIDFEKITDRNPDDRTFFQDLMATIARLAGTEAIWIWRQSDGLVREYCRAAVNQQTDFNPMSMDGDQLNLMLNLALAADTSKSMELHLHPQLSSPRILTLAKLFRSNTPFVVGLVWDKEQITLENMEIIHGLYEILQSVSDSSEPTAEAIPSQSNLEQSNLEQSTPLPLERPEFGQGIRGTSMQPIGLERLSEFVHRIHGSLEWKETVRSVADETQAVLDCDRVSVVLKKRGRLRLVAISGQHSVNFRSDVVLALQKLSRVVLKTRTWFWYPDVSKQRATPISRALDRYLSRSSAKTVVIIPIVEPTCKPDETGDYLKPPRFLGGLVFENFAEVWKQDDFRSRIELVSNHANDAIRNSTRHRRLFLYPLWRTIGNLRIVAAARSLSTTALVVLGLLGVAAALYYVPADLNVRAQGQLIPQTRRKVFAEVDGQVFSVKVGHGEEVETGQVLAELNSEELQVRLAEVSGKMESTQARLDVLKLTGLSRSNDDQASPASQQGNINSLRAELASLEEQQVTLNRMSERLIVKAPIEGQVLTWDPQQVLLNRPVQTGEELFEIAARNGDWQLELMIPDHRAGRVIESYHASEKPLVVSFVLASDPGQRFEGVLRELSQTTELGSDQKQLVRAIVDFDRELTKVDARQSRAGVVAKINCGQTNLGYAWLCDVFDFVESEILFRIW